MASERIDAYASALFAVAHAEDPLGEVDDELFRVARVLESSDQLMATLSDPRMESARRQQIVIDLLGGRAQPATVNLVSMVVGNGRVRDLPAIVDALTEMGAASRDSAVAEVRSAVALSEDQTARLTRALGQATGKNIEVKVVVDPSVRGGVVAQVGDTVIDGSVRRRLEQLRTAF